MPSGVEKFAEPVFDLADDVGFAQVDVLRVGDAVG